MSAAMNARLGPYELNSIITGDARKLIKGLPDSSIDVVITDPPYTAQVHSGARSSKTGIDNPMIDFPPIDDKALYECFSEVGRVIKRWVVATMDWQHIALFEKNPPPGLRFVRFGIWRKRNGAPQFTGDRPATGWEGICIMHKAGGSMHWSGGGRDSVFDIPRINATFNQTEKPIKLIRQFVELFSEPGEVILDPFAGSGTTGIACVELGRGFVGFEIDPDMAECARQRMQSAPLPLFILEPQQQQMQIEIAA